MTKKEFFKAVSENNITDEVIKKAGELLKKEEDDATKRSKAQTENRNANIELAKQIIEKMGSRTLAASEIFTLCNEIDGISSKSKVSAICRIAVEEGLMNSRDDYKVGGKGAKVKGYTPIIQTSETEPDTELEEEEEEGASWE